MYYAWQAGIRFFRVSSTSQTGLSGQGGARMKLHEIPHSDTEYRLRRRPRPYKILIYEDEHEDEKNQIRSLAYALRLFLFSAFHIPTSEFLRPTLELHP